MHKEYSSLKLCLRLKSKGKNYEFENDLKFPSESAILNCSPESYEKIIIKVSKIFTLKKVSHYSTFLAFNFKIAQLCR